MTTKSGEYTRCIVGQFPGLDTFNGIMLVGEAPGGDEEKAGKPFVGKAGMALSRLLVLAGIDRSRCAITNVFHNRPTDNKVHTLFTTEKTEACFPDYPMGFVYLRKEYAPEIRRLSVEMNSYGSHLKVVVALGGVALWALTGKKGITKERGMVSTFTHGKNACLMVPTFHPAYLLHKSNPLENKLVVDDLKLASSFVK